MLKDEEGLHGFLLFCGGRSGRPRRDVDLQAIEELRHAGRSWREIAVALKVPTRTLHWAWQNQGPSQAA